MKSFFYTQPLSIELTPLTSVYDEEGHEVFRFQRYYSNKLKKIIDRTMDYRYFLDYRVYDLNDQLLFVCKKISRKGRVYYIARDIQTMDDYMISYDKWKELVSDLLITGKDIQIVIDKEMESSWSRFIYKEKEIARWKADIAKEFMVHLEIEDDSPITNPAFFLAISQCVLFIGA